MSGLEGIIMQQLKAIDNLRKSMRCQGESLCCRIETADSSSLGSERVWVPI